MAAKVVNLTVHKNTKRQRERKQMRADMVKAAKDLGSEADLSGWLVLSVGENGRVTSVWDTGRKIPTWAFPSVVAESMRTDANNVIADMGGEDDFEPDN